MPEGGGFHPAPRHGGISPVVAIGASTGGVSALETVLSNLGGDTPPVLIVQHMPAAFLRQFAKRLEQVSSRPARVVDQPMALERGTIFLAAGGRRHMALAMNSGIACVEPVCTDDDDMIIPSIDVLFNSLAETGFGPLTTAIVLTGMGDDGAKGMLALKQAGAETWVESAKTATIFSMPSAAIELNAVTHILSRHIISDRLSNMADARMRVSS